MCEPETVQIYGEKDMKGENMGILIGKRGQTLDSLQYLANRVANKHQIGESAEAVADFLNSSNAHAVVSSVLCLS